MIKPATVNLDIYQGSNFYYPFEWVEGDVAIDITGYKFRMHIRETINSEEILINATTENGYFYMVDPLVGKFYLDIPSSETKKLTVSRAVYDIEVVFPSGQVSRIMQGCMNISPEVTRESD